MPQQNGVCECKNRTIMNMVRSLFTRSSVPKAFWPEAVNWSIHILNRSPTFSVQNMTRRKLRTVESLMLIISEFSDVFVMPVFQNKQEQNLMTKVRNAFFLVLAIVPKLTNYIILSPRKLSLIET